MAKGNGKSTAKKSKSSGAVKTTKARSEKRVESEKLVEYVGRAAGKERHIEAALAAHLVMTTRPAYHGRLEEHLRATKVRAEKLEGRVKELGGSTRSISGAGAAVMGEVKDAAKMVADRAVSLAKGPLDAMRDDHEAETLLENARVEYSDACEQIGTYTVVRALAKAADDKTTGKLAKDFRDEHAEMAEFVEKLIPKLSTAVVKTEAREAERASSGGSRGSGGTRGSGAARSSGSSSGASSRSRGNGAGRSRSGSARSTRSTAAPASKAATTAAGAISGSSSGASGSSQAKRTPGRASGGAPKRPATPKRG